MKKSRCVYKATVCRYWGSGLREEGAVLTFVIFINGLAYLAIEPKLNPSGQSVQDATKQLKGRNPNNRLFRSSRES